MKKFTRNSFISLILVLVSILFCGCNFIQTDYKTIVNTITTEKMSSNVTIYANYASFSYSATYCGSGVIFYQTPNTQEGFNEYWVLTNNHVVGKSVIEDSAGIKHTVRTKTFEIQDYKLNVISDSALSLVKNLAEYDLALLKFTTDQEYCVINLADEDPKFNSEVFSIGQPISLAN